MVVCACTSLGSLTGGAEPLPQGIETTDSCAAVEKGQLLGAASTHPRLFVCRCLRPRRRRVSPMAAPVDEEKKVATPSGLSPKEEGELEDGEISDDDNNNELLPEHSSSSRGGNVASSKGLSASRRRPPPDLRGCLLGSSAHRFSHVRHQPLPPPDLGHLHGRGGGYRLKEIFRSHPPPPPPPSSSCSRLPPGSHPDSGPRLSFWERSHNALDRFRVRGRPYRGGGRWGRTRGGNPPGRPPGGGGGYGGNQAWREPSPRRCILDTPTLGLPFGSCCVLYEKGLRGGGIGAVESPMRCVCACFFHCELVLPCSRPGGIGKKLQ